jgi:S1-C subfamily serine protease
MGALAAIAVYDPPDSEQVSAAQEPGARQPAPQVASRGDPRVSEPAREVPPQWNDLTPEERVNVSVYEACNRSAVNIDTRTVHGVGLFMQEITSEGEASGTVIDRQGHVLTNYHVVEDAREIHVTLYNSQTYSASLVGVDPATDVAVLKIDAPPDTLFPVVFGNSSELLVGQRVYAIGNPFGLERTLTTGIISNLNRSLPGRSSSRALRSLIQIDAAINPGSSGGPLLDTKARMIGMNTAIASKTGENAGVGFAIPVNTIARVVPQLIRSGRVSRPDLGITRVYETEYGLLIAGLEPGGAGEKAGLRGPQIVRRRKRQGPIVYEYQTLDRTAADLIVAADGQPIHSADDLLTIADNKKPGEVLVITVVRDKQRLDVPVRLQSGG